MVSRNATILNFLMQHSGGGVQNALSFIETLSGLRATDDYHVFARKDSPIASKAKALGFPTSEVAGGVISQSRFGMTCKRMFSANQLCFTLFGPPWQSTIGHLINVCGVAYSNLYYPEIDFWKQYGLFPRWKREVKDRLRRRAVGNADHWIFETEVLAKRAIQLARYPKERVHTVRMTASTLVSPERIKPEIARSFNDSIPCGFRYLFLAGAAPNKRIDRTAAIAARMTRLTDKPFVIVTTMPTDASHYQYIANKFQQLKIAHLLCNVGPCPFDHVASLISVCDSMGLFSVLESFSNNFVESWRMRKPLVATDADWSRSSAGSAAAYLDPDDPDSAADVMTRLLIDPEHRRNLIESGTATLHSYPTAKEKCLAYLTIFDSARELGMLDDETRHNLIRWKYA